MTQNCPTDAALSPVLRERCDVLSTCPCSTPGGLEIKPSRFTINVQDFTCKKQVLDSFAFHRVYVNLSEVYAATGDKFLLEGCLAGYRKGISMKAFKQPVYLLVAHFIPYTMFFNLRLLA